MINYNNPYVFGGNIILCVASGGHNTKLDDGDPIPYGAHYWNSDRLYEPPWKGHSNIHHDASQMVEMLPNEDRVAPAWFTGYAARIEGSQGDCSVRYYIKGGAGRHWAAMRDIGGFGEKDADSSSIIDGVPGDDFTAKTGWLHWSGGDTGIKHFAIQVMPESDAYAAGYNKRLCVVIDQPSGCGLKACFRRDYIPHECNAVTFRNTGLQYYEMRSTIMGPGGGVGPQAIQASGSWPPKGEPRCGLYTHPFGDPVRDIAMYEYNDGSMKKGPCTGWVGPGAPRLEWTVTIRGADDEGG